MSEAPAFKDFDVLSEQEQVEAKSLLNRYKSLEKQEETKKTNSLPSSQTLQIGVCQHILSRLDDGFARKLKNHSNNAHRRACRALWP